MAEDGNKQAAPREFVVLQAVAAVAAPEGATAPAKQWEEMGKVNAANRELALRAVVPEGTEGEYNAVPARSWKPMRIKLEPRPPKLVIE